MFQRVLGYCTLALLMPGHSLAQASRFELGIETGPNLSNVVPVHNSDNGGLGSASLRFSFGIAAQYNLDSIFSLKSGIEYDGRGFAPNMGQAAPVPASPSNPFGLGSPNLQLDYLVVPLFFKISTGDNAKFFVNGGPYFAYLLDARLLWTTYPAAIGSSPIANNRVSGINPADLGLAGGFGFDFPVKQKMTLNFELRFNFGLTYTDYSWPDQPTVNQSFELLFGMRYRL